MTSFEPRSGTKPHRLRPARRRLLAFVDGHLERLSISRTGEYLPDRNKAVWVIPSEEGRTGLLKAGALEVLCTVVWVKEGQCGVRFDEAVSPKMFKRLQLDGAVTIEFC